MWAGRNIQGGRDIQDPRGLPHWHAKKRYGGPANPGGGGQALQLEVGIWDMLYGYQGIQYMFFAIGYVRVGISRMGSSGMLRGYFPDGTMIEDMASSEKTQMKWIQPAPPQASSLIPRQ